MLRCCWIERWARLSFIFSFFLSFFFFFFFFFFFLSSVLSFCFVLRDLSLKDIWTHQQHTADCERGFTYETDSFFFFFFFIFIVVLLVAMPCASVHSSMPCHPPINPLSPLKFSISRQWSLDPNTERRQSSVLVWSPKKNSPHPTPSEKKRKKKKKVY